jgi:hypothetical protein
VPSLYDTPRALHEPALCRTGTTVDRLPAVARGVSDRNRGLRGFSAIARSRLLATGY